MDGMDGKKPLEAVKIKPNKLPFLCPNCNGRGHVGYEKRICVTCKGRGVIIVEQDVKNDLETF